MSSKIKGIVIDISGDTSKLQKSLNQLNAPINKINSELKDINKALQFDPKNTELLAQKHEILTRSIAETREKLKQLQEAQAKMGEYNSLTEEQKATYNRLSAEISKTESSLQKMNNELRTTTKFDFSKLTNGLKKVGEIAVDISKKLLQVSSAIGGALASVVALGVKSYASLEQNIGGIQKLFGKSADKLIENSKQAYKTAGLSANQYMETATSFSASLLKGLGNNTEKAVKLTDRAIRDMSDNANTFGTSMEDVMNVYKALSKEQFSTLDNLKLGYAGTKTGMKQLIKDASEYAKKHKELGITVNASSMSFDNMINAISVMQSKLNITGTTMKEAEQTIQGSISTLKASFDNFINGTGSPEALSESLMNVITNISKAIEKLAPSILHGLVETVFTILPEIPKIIKDTLPLLIDSINDLIDDLWDYIAEDSNNWGKEIGKLISKIGEFITKNLPKILDSAILITVALAEGITEAIPKLVPAVYKCLLEIINVIIDNLDLIVDTAIQLITVLSDTLISDENLDKFMNDAPKIIEALVEGLARNLPKLIEAGLRLIEKLIEGQFKGLSKVPEMGFKIVESLCKGIYNALPQISAKAWEIVEKIREKLGELPDKAFNWGKDMIDGFVRGIKGMLGKVGEAAGKIGNKVKEFLHFSRPDTGPLRDYETWMPDFVKGLAKTLKESSGILMGATSELASDMSSSLLGATSQALRSLNAGVNTSLNPTINPTYSYELNYKMMALAMKQALEDMSVELDDRQVGKIIDKTVSEEIYG